MARRLSLFSSNWYQSAGWIAQLLYSKLPIVCSKGSVTSLSQAIITTEVGHVGKFPPSRPSQCVIQSTEYTIIIYPNLRCRFLIASCSIISPISVPGKTMVLLLFQNTAAIPTNRKMQSFTETCKRCSRRRYESIVTLLTILTELFGETIPPGLS